jgi:hypothetical protein
LIFTTPGLVFIPCLSTQASLISTKIISAIKELTSVDNDEDARKEVIKELWSFERGKMFIAQHLLGMPTQEVKQTNLNIDATDLTDEEVLRIKKALDNAY